MLARKLHEKVILLSEGYHAGFYRG